MRVRAAARVVAVHVPSRRRRGRDVAECAHRGAEGGWEIAPEARRIAAERGDDPSAIRVGDDFLYVNAVGSAVPVLAFDNGPDYFVAGLARTIQDGKVGFFDEDLAIVIAPRWDFAFPFEGETAVVCDGCTSREIGDGHREVFGGRWGAIDRRGRIAIPVIHSREAVRALREQ